MLFNSYIFWLFFGTVLILYRMLPHRGQNSMLLVASYVFYGSWDYRFLSLILAMTVVNYLTGRGMANAESPRRRKSLLVISLVTCLGVLGIFKYMGFFTGELSALVGLLGLNLSVPMVKVILPVGISFYTFQTLSYTIDIYRGKVERARNFFDFALFVAFFPQLVAGPIERYSHLMPQIETPRHVRPNDFAQGLLFVLGGMFTKVVVADNMADLVNAVFASPLAELSGMDCLMGVYAFAFQILGDFAGYSAIAIGVSKWLGFDLIVNFRMPYFATTPSEFWRRWHVSLSRWLRDYLYISLGGNRAGKSRTIQNLFATMILGGLWHGAGWTFLAWGFLHGLLLAAYRVLKLDERKESGRWSLTGRVISTVVLFQLVCAGWLLFRAETIGQAGRMFAKIFTDLSVTHLSVYIAASILFYVTPMMLLEYWQYRKDDVAALLEAPWQLRAAVYSYFALMIWFFPPETVHEFIYFQF